MKELLPDIFTETIPLPGSPLKWLNSYIVKGGDRFLLVDTPFNMPACETAALSFLSELDAPLERTDIFITHIHVDHCGLTRKFKRPQNKVFASEKDSGIINAMVDESYWAVVAKNNERAGMPKEEALDYREHVAFRYKPEAVTPFTIAHPGDMLNFGQYRFSVVDLSGHSPGQIGLFDDNCGVMFCGDHVLDKISPNISTYDLETDYLALYLKNLKAIRNLPVRHLLTAHRELPDNPQKRIDTLIRHHEQRLDEVLSIAKMSRKATPYEVAVKMKWSIAKTFNDFPKMQKWFACSEAMAHLQYLYFHGALSSNQAQTPLTYWIG